MVSVTNILEPTRGLIVPTKIFTNKTLRRIACFQRQIRKFRLAPLARNQLFMFSVRYYCQKKGHAINCPWKTGDSAPSTPDKGSVRNFNGRISFYHCWRSNRRPLFAQNSRASGGSAPWAPGRGPKAGSWTPPVYKGTRTRMDIFRPLPLFLILNGPAYPYIHDRRGKMTRTPTPPPPPPAHQLFRAGGMVQGKF